METIWSKEIDEALKIGHYLDEVGVRNWALTKKQALNVLGQFIKLGVSVLGGDVYEVIDDVIQSNYDSWHCDINPGEARSDFVVRSVEESREYIESYKKQGDKIFFALVPKS